MNVHNDRDVGGFGRQLRFWRDKRKLSQLELAALAETTPRHISFVETGRSRPGRDLILRIARAMDLPVREVNALMASAGLPPEYAEHEFGAEQIKPYRTAIEAILENHNPFPAAAIDGIGTILLANDAFMAFSPNALGQTPEQNIDQFFDPNGDMRKFIENWEEITWNWLDRQKSEFASTNNPRLGKLVQLAEAHLKGMVRPDQPAQTDSAVLSPRFRVGDQIISTFATMMRFENVTEVTLSEIRVELVFPVDDVSRLFFEDLYKNYKALPSPGIG